jgi:hypothetical protein
MQPRWLQHIIMKRDGLKVRPARHLLLFAASVLGRAEQPRR